MVIFLIFLFFQVHQFLFVLDHPHCHSTALVFSLYTRRDTTVMTRMHVRSSMRAHSPLSGSSVNESCAQDTEQKHGKRGSGALLSSFPLLLGVVLAEHGGCLSFVDRDRELRIWTERGARQNERETRCWLTIGTNEELVTGVILKSQIVLGYWS